MAKDKEADTAEEAKGGKKKLFIMIGAAVVVLGVVYWFFLKPVDPAAAAEAAKPVEGAVVVADPIHINLADGHFLKLGLALQVIEGPAHEPDPAKALDAAITMFSGKDIEKLQSPKELKELKEKLAHTIEEEYHHDVMGIYFTEFVVQ